VWFFGQRKTPRLDWIQIEVTSRCQAACVYCPNTVWKEKWLAGDFRPELLDRLLPQLRRGTIVHLQGWGEPLLHPGLAEMVRTVSRAGCRPTTTTNGVALNVENALVLMEAGLEILGLSLSVTDSSLHDRLRKGTSVRHLLTTMEAIAGELVRRQLDRHRLRVAYLITRSGFKLLPDALRTLTSAGVQTVVVSSLDLIPSEEMVSETLMGLGEAETEALSDVIERAQEVADEIGVELIVQLASAPRPGRCPERPDRSLFVGWDGAVFPCVYSGIPAQGGVRHWTQAGALEFRRAPLGYIEHDELATLWQSEPARLARRAVKSPRHHEQRCRECVKPFVEKWEPTELESLWPGI